jgi:hypothetical protein
MKTLPLLAIVFFVALFVAGFVWPRRSRRFQRWVSRLIGRGEAAADERQSVSGELTRKTLVKARHGSDKSAEKRPAVAITADRRSLPE